MDYATSLVDLYPQDTSRFSVTLLDNVNNVVINPEVIDGLYVFYNTSTNILTSSMKLRVYDILATVPLIHTTNAFSITLNVDKKYKKNIPEINTVITFTIASYSATLTFDFENPQRSLGVVPVG